MNWDIFKKEIENLAAIINSNFDSIVLIARGGLVPGRILSSKLHVKEMFVLTVKKSGKDRQVVTEIKENIAGKKILLVEDILETGRSMILAQKYLEDKGASIKTACLYTMPQAKITPGYFLEQIDLLPSFPWE